MSTALDDPMGAVHDVLFVALVGIIDPLRAETKDAVAIAHRAGIDVRMITGDHTITARAIADELGLGAGVATGAELAAMTDAQVVDALPELHVFGRVKLPNEVVLLKHDSDVFESHMGELRLPGLTEIDPRDDGVSSVEALETPDHVQEGRFA